MKYLSFLINNKSLRILAAAVVGAVSLFYVAGSFNWKQIRAALETADLFRFLSGAVITLAAFFLFKTARWHTLLRSEEADVPFGALYLYNAVSIGISNVTPFQSGEAVKVELLRKYGVSRARGYTIFFVEKFLDLATVIGMGVFGAAFGFDFGVSHFYFYALAAFFAVGIAAAGAIVFSLPFERLNPVKVLLREKWRRKGALLAAVFFTLCSWTAAVLGWKITLISVSINIGAMQAVSLVSLTVLLALISFVPGAVGVSEIGVTAILTRMGVGLSLAQTGAVALRGYAVTLLLFALLHWAALKFLPKKLLLRAAAADRETALFREPEI